MTALTFSEWLWTRLDERKMKPLHLAQQAGVHAATITRLINEYRNPGPDAARAIAKGLNLPQWEVFVAAGLMTEKPNADNKSFSLEHSRLERLVSQLKPDDVRLVRAIVEAVITTNGPRQEESPKQSGPT